MKIYLACCFDRHIDPVIKPFSTEAKAIQFSKDFCKEKAWYTEDIEEKEITRWLFYATYSGDEDYVFVIEEDVE